MYRLVIIGCFVLCSLFTLPDDAVAQNDPDPRGAFLRSLAVPGWGHHYVDSNNWNRGKAHLGAELSMIAGYFGLRARASNIENQYLTLVNLRAGIDITNRGRTFQLAIGDYNTLQEYNDFQLRSRNWNRLIDDEPENRWNWASERDRIRYNELRSDRDRIRNQLPAIIGLMAVNRVVSAVSAFNRARDINTPELTITPFNTDNGESGVVATLTLRF
ncbi:MAG: hypothetical protein EA391_07830 [Balneolaceae bacterium]|nr:MAG: hypothetical protein EA391_07830 [Balneolaceae bacterium]